MWVSNLATLIYGKRDDVLVDTFPTIYHGVELADQIAASGKNLTYIYVTHGHGDHFFGINLLKRRFPSVRAVAPASVVDRVNNRLAADMQLLRGRFPRTDTRRPGQPREPGWSIDARLKSGLL